MIKTDWRGETMGEYMIDLKGVSKAFRKDQWVLDDIHLSILEKEFVTLLGPSGCGKTTTLRIIGGFEAATRGDVLFEGKSIRDLPPYERQINTVFQKYALFPHMNVFENIAFGLNIKRVPKEGIQKKVKDMLSLIDLKGFEKRRVHSLSGGQQQRVAIARALVNEPKVLLLDEPLGALDLQLRKEMQVELKKIQEQVGITFLYVTHDQEEALTMSDRVVVMNEGRIEQIGRPEDIYNEPKTPFVANFIGESNLFEGEMKQDNLVYFQGKRFQCVDKAFADTEKVFVVVRPEDVELTGKTNGIIEGEVLRTTFKGIHYEMMIKSLEDEKEWKVHSTERRTPGEVVGITVRPDLIHIMKRG